MKKGILKIGVIFLLFILLVGISNAEKFSAKNGSLIKLGNITNFIKEDTKSVLKANIHDSNGRIFLIVTSESEDKDKVNLKMDLRNFEINPLTNQITGSAKISYKITNNGFFIISPVPDENGYFHNIRIGQKPTIKETRLENVAVTFENNFMHVTSDFFEIKDLEFSN